MQSNRIRTFFLLIASATLLAGGAQAGGPGHCYDPSDRSGYVCAPCGCPADRVVSRDAGACKTCGMDRVALKSLKHVAILLYEGVELLDFAGPAEVFASAGYYVYTVSARGNAVKSGGVTVDPEYSIRDCPWPDVLVVPGGHTEALTGDVRAMRWVGAVSGDARVVMSVCSGAFVLAKSGALDGLEATTHSADIAELERAAPKTRVHTGTRFVDNGKIVTTAGVSSGIDGALHVVMKLSGEETARNAARYLEYESWKPGAGTIVSAR